MIPIGHVAIAVPIGFVLRLQLVVVSICAILPDLIDKPLWAMGIGGPRYIAHTVLFLAVITLLLFFWKRRYAFAAFLGIGSHLFLDWIDGGAVVPWLYPFKSYSFPPREFDPSQFLTNLWDDIEHYFLYGFGNDLIGIAIVVVAVTIFLWISWWYHQRKRGV